MCRILRVGMPDNDDEVLHEFDSARGQTRMDIYRAVMRPESDYELEKDEPQPKKMRRSTRFKRYVYYNTEDIKDFEDEVFTPD